VTVVVFPSTALLSSKPTGCREPFFGKEGIMNKEGIEKLM
jgi:hypothetical protein